MDTLHVCQVCGTLHEELTDCCGQATVPFEQAMGDQLQLFELSGNDRAQHVLRRLKISYENAAERVNRAEKRLADAVTDKDAAAAVLMDFYKLTTAGNPELPAGDPDLPLGVMPTPPLPPERPQGPDPLLWTAAEILVTSGLGSTSMLQRRLKVGYARAGAIMDELERLGVVGPANGAVPRTLLLGADELLALREDTDKGTAHSGGLSAFTVPHKAPNAHLAPCAAHDGKTGDWCDTCAASSRAMCETEQAASDDVLGEG